MNIKNYVVLLAALMLGLASCKKGANTGPSVKTPTSNKDTDVYVAGFVAAKTDVAALWKNGVETKLADGTKISYANAIAISGSDVYVAGSIADDNASFPMAVYWKNGAMIKLSDNLPHSSANAIVVAGNDVYIAGSINYVATMWKNGVATRLDAGNVSEAFGLAVSGTDVYVSGYVSGPGTGSIPTYWKNGTGTKLGSDNYGSIAYAVAVNGSDVYLAGNENGFATLWKNGTPSVFDTNVPAGDAFGITLANSAVYVVSDNLNSYWKNGTKVAVPGYGFPDAITTTGSDVYVAGATPDGFPAPYVCYWKNGVLHRFGDGGMGKGIAVEVK